MSDRELLARLIKCEAEGEGVLGMQSVATVVMNRVRVPYGEYRRVNQGDLRKVITQKNQFTCMLNTVGGKTNPRTIWSSPPDAKHYQIADWAIAGQRNWAIPYSLWYMNPFSSKCPPYFPYNQTGVYHTRINQHCFHNPTAKYRST